MSSSSSPPQLAPVREFAPIDMNIQQEETEEVTSKLQETKLRADTLESGAPETEAEASLGQPSRHAQSTVDKQKNFAKAAEKIGSKLEKVLEDVISEEAAHLDCYEHRAVGRHPAKDSISVQAQQDAVVKETTIKDDDGTTKAIPAAVQSKLDKERNFRDAVDLIKPKLDYAPETITNEEADLLHSREVRAHGDVEKGGITAQAQSIAAHNEQAPSMT